MIHKGIRARCARGLVKSNYKNRVFCPGFEPGSFIISYHYILFMHSYTNIDKFFVCVK